MRAFPWRHTVLAASLTIVWAVGWGSRTLQAADQWIEVKSPHFTVLSNTGDGTARLVAWQFEQIRSVIEATCPWARLDLNRPLTVIALKDENSMRALAPRYWEEKGSIRPASVWVSASDQFYLALRTDVNAEERVMINPYQTSYFSYVSLILNNSFPRRLPPWLQRGLSSVLSNTIVRNSDVVVGAPIPWYLGDMRAGSRLPLRTIVSLAATAPELRRDDVQRRFDAQAWALVSFLLFADNGARARALDQFVRQVADGGDPAAAFAESLGKVDELEAQLLLYINRPVLGMGVVKSDVRVKREGFTTRTVPIAEHASARATFHVAMQRPAEARLAIDEARKADAAAPGSYVAEAMLLDSEKKPDEARAVFAKAVDGGSTTAFAHYRLASLSWKADADRQTLQQVEKALVRAVALNDRYAAAYAFLAEIRSSLNADSDALSLARRAISLEPAEPNHHLTAASVLWRQQQLAEARKEALSAMALSDSDAERQRAQEMIDGLAKVTDRTAAARAPGASAEPTGAAATTSAPARADVGALALRCQSGDEAACTSLLPMMEAECTRNAAACGNLGWMYGGGHGVAADPVRAAALFSQACTAGEHHACVSHAVLQAQGKGVPRDVNAARKTLEAECTSGLFDACTNLALMIRAEPQPDLARVQQLLSKSCDGKFAPACELLKSLPK